jgi:hypothetical protein
MVSRHDGVEIELGSMVYDEAAEEERDVDVTVKSTDNEGVVSAFEGIEVKRHTRPLNVIEVEQLCKKLNDMPEITHRSIVSASGYYDPAIRKANKNDVDLFLLKDWSGPLEISGVTLAEGLTVQERGFRWVGSPHVQVNPNMHLPDRTVARIQPHTKIVDANGSPLTEAPDFRSLGNLLASKATMLAEQQGQPLDIEIGDVGRFGFNIAVEFEALIDVDGEKIPVTEARVTGELTRVENVITPDLKALVKLGEEKPYAGCAIFEMSHGNLAALTVNPDSRLVVMINIPVSDRLLKKIYRRRLK